MFEKYADDLKTIDLFPKGKVFRLCYDNTVNKLRILSHSYEAFDELREAFSVENSSAFFASRYGYSAAKRLYQINKFGYFGNGLVWEILNWIRCQYGDISCVAVSSNCKLFLEEQLLPLKGYIQKNQSAFDVISNIADDTGRNVERRNSNIPEFKFRDYQEEAIRHLLTNGFGRGLIELPTASGKSFVLANFCWNLHKNYDRNIKFMLLVPNKQLVSQMYNDFIDYGYDPHVITQFTAGLKGKMKYNPDARIIIANRQYVFKNEKLLPKIDALICDECHQTLSDSTMAWIERLNAPIKIGCSGTLPRQKFDRWKILSLFSKVVFEQSITELQDRGFISKLKIVLMNIVDKNVESNTDLLFNVNSKRKFKPDENGYSDIEFNEASNAENEYFSRYYKELYKPVFDYLHSLNSNTLILFDRIDIGKNLFEYAKLIYTDKNVYYIDGSIKVDEREVIRSGFEKSDGNLLIAQSAVFSTGINIKRLTNLVFLTGSKSYSRVLQSIGRTLRLHSSKQQACLIDVSWNFKYSQKHLHERLRLYKDAYGKKPDQVINAYV